VPVYGRKAKDLALYLKTASKIISKSRLGVEWLLVGKADSSLRADLGKLAKKPGAKFVEIAEEPGDWPCFCQAAVQARGKWLLLLPSSAKPQSIALPRMLELGKRHKWIGAASGSRLLWLIFFLNAGARKADLSSPCLVNREFLNLISARYNWKEALLGLRILSRAWSIKDSVFLMPASGGPRPGLAKRFGLDNSRLPKTFLCQAGWLAFWAALTYAGLMLAGKYVFFGLPLLAVAAVCLATQFGKPE
jgi:hypothetical protein